MFLDVFSVVRDTAWCYYGIMHYLKANPAAEDVWHFTVLKQNKEYLITFGQTELHLQFYTIRIYTALCKR